MPLAPTKSLGALAARTAEQGTGKPSWGRGGGSTAAPTLPTAAGELGSALSEPKVGEGPPGLQTAVAQRC